MPNDLSIADRCRKFGLRVVEVAGWQSRGRPYDFRPGGSVNHHTAGSPYGTCPSLGGVINGFAGSAPGPLANALQSREPDGNDIIYIVAAGVANHAGVGGWRGLTGNSRVIGLEIEHIGTVPLPEYRQKIAARFHAAMAEGRWSSDMVCQHYEWAPPGTKIDAATNVDRNLFREWVREALNEPNPGPPPVEDDDMKLFFFRVPDAATAEGRAKVYSSDGIHFNWCTNEQLQALQFITGVNTIGTMTKKQLGRMVEVEGELRY